MTKILHTSEKFINTCKFNYTINLVMKYTYTVEIKTYF